MTKKNLFFSISLAFCLLFLLPFRSYGMEAKITDMLLTSATENVMVYFKVADCFNKDMEEAIFAGIPVTFTFLLEVYQERKYWFDKRKTRIEIKRTIKYDNIKKIFYVSFAGEEGKPATFRDVNNAKRAMAELNGVAVVPLDLLKAGERYYIRVKAKLGRVNLPQGMGRILFFKSMWDFETDWHRQEFVY